ncbi:O-antigen ligase family protein [Mycobacterium sp. HNNTM2301]|uniref:O-antigen ligase family protein n=1 Tax=Mycobacterium hainanense TaxID=3289775 RepID=UPI0035A5F7D8
MILYVRGRRRFVYSGAIMAAFLFACFVFGALSVRNFRGLALLGLLFCVAVYRIKPELMVWVALFLSFAALPAEWHMGMVFGPVDIWAYHAAVLLAIGYLISIVKPRLSAYLLPGMFLFVVVCGTIAGFATGHEAKVVVHEAQFLCEVIGGFMLGLLIVYCGYAKGALHAVAVTLWFSAPMIVAGSLHVIHLAGAEFSLAGTGGGCSGMAQCAGAAASTRVITAADDPAIAVLTALVAAAIVGRVRLGTYLALGPPAAIITLLSFARISLIEIGVSALVAIVASLGWWSLRRTGVLVLAVAAVFAVTVPGALFLFQHSPTGDWLADQYTAFNNRVLGGVSTKVLAVDHSVLDRLAEDANLNRAIAQAPVFGNGLGYAYQLPFGKPGSFTAGEGTTYAHNFYLWWLAKAGAVGMASFALFALIPLIRALRCASAPAKISVAVSVALLVSCTVNPMPEGYGALTLGLALGAAMGFGSRGRKERPGAEQPPALTVAEPAPALTGGAQ